MRAAIPGLLALTLVAAAMSSACATRQYSYAFETKEVASSGKAGIASGGISLTTDNSFSEAAFLGSPVYLNQMHLATAARGIADRSYAGTLSICVKRPLLWKRSQAPSPEAPQSQPPSPGRGGCGAGVRSLTVDVTSGSSRPSAAAQATAASGECPPGACTDPNNASGDRRIFELDIPFMDTRLRVAIAYDAATPSAATNTKQQHLNDLTGMALPDR
jgi:hypothetical protein